tara:strand:+ start:465 stop:737 length:273 start_codon:yes stop_codon:yes gene_type:complete
MAEDTVLKGEHFSKNNPDMKLYFAKPTQEEINEMQCAMATTSYKEAEKHMSEVAKEKPIYMDGSDVMPTPNADWIDDKKKDMPGSWRNTQ